MYITIIKTPVFGSFKRDCKVFLKKAMVASLSVSLLACNGFCGSSSMMQSPPSPVSAPPTEVENIRPWWLFLNSFCRFTSSFRLNRSPQLAAYHGDCIMSRVKTLCLRLRLSEYETFMNRRSGCFTHVQAG